MIGMRGCCRRQIADLRAYSARAAGRFVLDADFGDDATSLGALAGRPAGAKKVTAADTRCEHSRQYTQIGDATSLSLCRHFFPRRWFSVYGTIRL